MGLASTIQSAGSVKTARCHGVTSPERMDTKGSSCCGFRTRKRAPGSPGRMELRAQQVATGSGLGCRRSELRVARVRDDPEGSERQVPQRRRTCSRLASSRSAWRPSSPSPTPGEQPHPNRCSPRVRHDRRAPTGQARWRALAQSCHPAFEAMPGSPTRAPMMAICSRGTVASWPCRPIESQRTLFAVAPGRTERV
jgi:hypothetical protein